MTQRSTFMDAPYYDMPHPQDQPPPINYDQTFEEEFQQALDRIEHYNQLSQQTLHSFMQSLKELAKLALTLNQEEGRKLSS